jgi:beta-carotene 3-hydroxylase
MILALIIIATFIVMEGVAWAMHKYVMHGMFWYFHEDHHTRENHNSIFERNDSFFLFFSVLAMSSFIIWSVYDLMPFLGIAIGICIYGAAYFFIHDLFIHQRIKVLRNTKNPYLKAIRRAHKIHHKHLGKEDGECFGMLWVPMKYFRAEFKSR